MKKAARTERAAELGRRYALASAFGKAGEQPLLLLG